MTLTPLNIREKKLIQEYAEIFLTLLNKISPYCNDNSSQIKSQRLLLLLTMVAIINSKTVKAEFIPPVSHGSSDKKINSFHFWTWLADLISRSNKSQKHAIQHFIPMLPDKIMIEVYSEICTLSLHPYFGDVLPYILEVFEYDKIDFGTALHDSRRGLVPFKKKRKGIYYTPNDVAQNIVKNTLGKKLLVEFDNIVSESVTIKDATKLLDILTNIKVLDPSCGTGIFLRLSLQILSEKYCILNKKFNYRICPLASSISNNLYGIDKSNSAIESCILILLTSDIQLLLKSDHSIFTLWNLAYQNIKYGDSTVSDLSNTLNETISILAKQRKESKKQILLGEVINNPNSGAEYNFNFQLEFPEVFSNNIGFHCIIGNPPYSKLPKSEPDRSYQQVRYVSARESKDSNYFTLFVENMKYLCNSESSFSGLVIPLSISYHQGDNYKLLRKLIMKDSGKWKFEFFDRSPDSLFGDDIKTRNCIVYRESSERNEMYTSPLIRWNSRERDKLFSEIPSINITGLDITNYIPKLSNQLESEVLCILNNNKELKLIDLTYSSNLGGYSSVYFYSTAYNWLPVFKELPLSLDETGKDYIPSSVWKVNCTNEQDKNFLFSVVSSKISYWYWIVNGDGFHFSKQFLSQLPVHPSLFNPKSLEKISRYGELLWLEMLKYPTRKTNAGKTIGNFNVLRCKNIIDEIDKLIIREIGLPDQFFLHLQHWYYSMIKAGRKKFKNAEYLIPTFSEDNND